MGGTRRVRLPRIEGRWLTHQVTFSDTSRASALVLAQLVVSAPYFVYGFGYVREEWTFLGDAQAGGAWNAALESTRRARPLVAALYAAIYGVAENPMAWHLILVGLNAAVAVALFVLLRAWITRDNAFLVSLVWVLLPTHMTLDHWLAATNITLSLLLLLLGLLALTRSVDRCDPGWKAGLLLCGSALFYDAIIPVALVALAVMPMMRRCSPRSWLIRGGVPLALIGGYVTIQFRDRGSEPASLIVAVGQNLFYGLSSTDVVQTTLVCAVSIGCLLVFRDLLRRSAAPHSEHVMNSFLESSRMVIAGFAVMLVGTTPFLTSGFDAQFSGLGDRMNMIASIGAALVLVGVIRRLAPVRIGAITAILLLALLVVPVRIEHDKDWSETSSYARRAAVHVAAATSSEQVSLRRNPLVQESMPGTRSDVEVARILRAGVLTRKIDVVRDADGIPIVTAEAIDLPR